MSENVRVTDVTVTEDGHFRLSMVTDNGVSVIELDHENAMRFAAEMLRLLDE